MESNKQMLCHKQDNMPSIIKNTVITHSAALYAKGVCRVSSPYLGCFGLTDSQSFSEIGIHGIIGFPFSLGWLDPVGNDLNEEAKRRNRVKTQKVHVVHVND